MISGPSIKVGTYAIGHQIIWDVACAFSHPTGPGDDEALVAASSAAAAASSQATASNTTARTRAGAMPSNH